MTMGGVALVAEQALRLARSRKRGLGERCQFIELVLRLGIGEMALEDAQHLVGMSAAHREPLILGVPSFSRCR